MSASAPARPSPAERAKEAADHRARWLLASPALIIIGLLSLLPMLIVLAYSFMGKGAYGGVEWRFSTDAWLNVVAQRDIFDGSLGLADINLTVFWRSIRLSFITTLLTLLIGVPTAYFIASRTPRSRNLWLFLITVPFWTSLLIRIIAIGELIRKEGLVNSALVGLGITTEPIQMLFTDFAIGLGMTYVYLPLMVLPVYAAVERLDVRLLEASYDLYASRWITFRRVILPIVKPGVISGSILVFVPSLGDYVTPRILGGGSNLMIGNLIDLQFGQGRNWPLGASLSITLSIMVLGALVFYMRNEMRGEASHG